MYTQVQSGSIVEYVSGIGAVCRVAGEALKKEAQMSKSWLDASEERSAKIERIVFCSFLEKDEKAYEELIP